jgi:hypothetical protein
LISSGIVCVCLLQRRNEAGSNGGAAESNEFANLCELATLLAPFLTLLSRGRLSLFLSPARTLMHIPSN